MEIVYLVRKGSIYWGDETSSYIICAFKYESDAQKFCEKQKKKDQLYKYNYTKVEVK